MLRALSKAPDERYATAAELADDLETYLRGGTLSTDPRPARAAWLVLAGAVCLAALAGALWGRGREGAPKPRAASATKSAAPPQASEEPARSGRTWRLIETLASPAPGLTTARARFAGGARLWWVYDHGPWVRVWEPAARRSLRRSLGSATWIRPTASAAASSVLWVGGFGPQLRRVDLLALDGPLRSIELPLPGKAEAGVGGLALSPDGRVAYLGTRSGLLHRISLPDGRVLKTVRHSYTNPIEQVALGAQVLVTTTEYHGPHMDFTVVEWDPATLTKRVTRRLQGAATALAMAPDGRTYAVGTRAFRVRLFRAGQAQQVAELQGEGTRPYAALEGFGSQKPAHSATVRDLCFSPDGARLYSAAGDDRDRPKHSGDLRVWDVATRRQLRVHGAGKSFASVAVHPDGTRLVLAHWGGRVELWELPER